MFGRQRRIVRWGALSAAVVAALSVSPAGAVITFNLVPGSGMSQQAIDGFTAASQRWSSLLSDTVTININIGFTALSPGVLGSASSSNTTYTYTNTRNALGTDRISADDFAGYASLQSGTGVNILLNYTSNNPNGAGSFTPYLDNDGDTNNTNIRINHANAKALGLRSATNTVVDASITFSSSFTWDFNPFDGITSGSYDFVGAAAHEIGHALGFVSGVDSLDTSGGTLADNQLTRITPLDLYRFSAASIASPGAVGVPDFTAGAAVKYFSLDGGVTSLAQFATGTTHGDGRQASHWKDNLGIGIMDPTAAPGELVLVKNFDRQAMDVIGWNVNNTWNWIDPAGGGFGQGVRWSTSIVPGAAQSVVFDLNNTYTVSFSGGQSSSSASFRAGTVTFSLAGNTYSVTNALHVAPVSGDNVTLYLSGGTVTAASVAIGGDGSSSGGTGLLRLSGGAALNVAQTVTIWPGGTLQLSGGGALSASSIALSGGTIRCTAGPYTIAPAINSTGGTLEAVEPFTLSGALTTAVGSTLNKTGNSSLTISGPQNHGANATLNVSTGTLNVQSNAGGVSTATLAINSTATTNFTVSQNLRNLSVTGGTTTLAAGGGSRSIKTSTLSVSGLGRLNLGDHQLIVDYTGPSVIGTESGSVYTGVTGLLQSGRDGGSWNGLGIVTSMSSATDGSGYTTLGVAEAADVLAISGAQTATWGDQVVDATSVLVKYTYGGDANLSGSVDIDDYTQIDSNAAVGGVLEGWFNGDFNYDTQVDIDDYTLIDSVVGIQGSPLLPGDGAQLTETMAASPVPEPSGAVLYPAGLAILRRRRRRG